MIPYFNRPSVAYVRERINLRPEQVNHLYGGAGATAEQVSTAYEQDIASHLEIASEWVEQRLDLILGDVAWPLASSAIAERYPNWSATRISSWRIRVENLLRDAATMRTAFLIFHKGGQLNESYAQKAEAYRNLCEEILTGPEGHKGEGGLLDQLAGIVSAQDDAETQPVNAPRSRVLSLRMGW